MDAISIPLSLAFETKAARQSVWAIALFSSAGLVVSLGLIANGVELYTGWS